MAEFERSVNAEEDELEPRLQLGQTMDQTL
jgi:hypothetical protein